MLFRNITRRKWRTKLYLLNRNNCALKLMTEYMDILSNLKSNLPSPMGMYLLYKKTIKSRDKSVFDRNIKVIKYMLNNLSFYWKNEERISIQKRLDKLIKKYENLFD